MTTEQYQTGYEEGYQEGWNAAMDEGKAPQPAPGEPYEDTTPHLSVGDSSFESWFSSYCPANKGDKQRARDAYAAGMGDPLVVAAPQQEAQEPVAWLVPTLQTFKGAERVHFTRAPGCSMTDAELIDHMEGRVVWIAKTFSDSPGITDKFGVEHKPKPLYTAPQPAPAPLSEREAFERWQADVLGRSLDELAIGSDSRGDYDDVDVHNEWVAWQARAALAVQKGK